MIPRATYRLQLHKDFTFADAARQAGYFADLGISHVYTSPILTARAGSLHGYDVIDHAHINPELGGEAGLRALAAALREHGLGLIVDIVPNHMAVGKADNAWWLDVLSKGQASAFAGSFDIDWETPGLEGKVLAPFLDGEPQALWDKGELTLVREDGAWAFAYYDHRFALRPQDQSLTQAPADWPGAEALLGRQNFVLADWRQADSRINWRRFFDITDLAALRMEDASVFEAVHAKIFALYGEGLIDGVRVDHVDGLADPAAYCRQLRLRLEAIRPGAYIIVEKILAEVEAMPAAWQVDGTTGYDAMNDIAALLHADDGGALEAQWQARRPLPFEQEEIIARTQILLTRFPAQLDGVTRAFAKALPDLAADTIKAELTRAIIALRCYRDYVTGRANAPPLGETLARALENAPSLRPLFDDRSGDPLVVDALRRFHQLTAPVAAKAVEDTAFYRYGRLLSRNDVGFDPRTTFVSPAQFHDRVQRRARDFPHAMLTTATHDHKRGEDARARLAVLSTMPLAWQDFVRAAGAPEGIDPADTYMLLQTLVGVWPELPDPALTERVEGWCRKYLREAKLRSSWQSPDTAYEDAFCGHAAALIDDDIFRAQIGMLLETIAIPAQANSLAQVALRYTLPGVPDLYQGCEFADTSLVDPDNRRAVDYAARAAALAHEPDGSFSRRKQALIARLLAARKMQPALWTLGDYTPVAARPGVIAFQRQHGAQLVTVAIRCNSQPLEGAIDLPGGKDLLTTRSLLAGPHACVTLFESWPVIVLFTEG